MPTDKIISELQEGLGVNFKPNQGLPSDWDGFQSYSIDHEQDIRKVFEGRFSCQEEGQKPIF
jgi:hypothetical protein